MSLRDLIDTVFDTAADKVAAIADFFEDNLGDPEPTGPVKAVALLVIGETIVGWDGERYAVESVHRHGDGTCTLKYRSVNGTLYTDHLSQITETEVAA